MPDDTTWRSESSNYDNWSRRRYLVAAGGIAALSGCTGGGGGNEETTESADDGGGGDSVPDVYMSATSLGGEQRDPDNLNAKDAVGFVEFEAAQENDAHEAGTCCANCADYIPDKDGDEFGACAEVGGKIDGEDWCTIYEELPEPEVPEGMDEAELATAEVPEEYRTADSQVGEARDPEDLLTHEDVNLTESVEAIADGVAQPGQSCGNCAEFIPDKNGDTWGACARVEGYIAVEDWCTTWEHVSAEL